MSDTKHNTLNLRERLDEANYLLDVLAEIFTHDNLDAGKHVLVRRIQADLHAVSDKLAESNDE